jgi:hypothetical protein
MKLYLVRGNDSHCENQDWFVAADDPTRAIDIWNDHLIENGFPRDDDDEEDSLPRKRTVDPANVREILDDVKGTRYDGAERAIGWEDLTLVMEA